MLTCKNKKIYKQIAFTLAEVLITLTVVGVIAAMTIPSLTSSTDNVDVVNKLKKTYSDLSNVTKQINFECGGSILNCLTDPNAAENDTATVDELASLYKKKLNIIKDCGRTSGTGCFANTMYINLAGNDVYNPDAGTWPYKMVLSSGVSLGIKWYTNDVSRFLFYVDINAAKGPNVAGRDYFYFSYNSNTNNLEPGGVNWQTGLCDTGNPGTGCAAYVLSKGKIDY